MPWQKDIAPLLAIRDSLGTAFVAPSEHGPVVDVSYVVVAVFDFGRIPTLSFFAALRCIAKKVSVNSLLVATLDPSPTDYYLRHFGAVPAFHIGPDMDDQDFLKSLSWDPAGGGADSIASHATRMIITDDQIAFVILGEHDFEVARLLVRPDKVHLKLQDCLPVDWRYDRDEILALLLESGVEAGAASKISQQLATVE